MSEKNYSIDVSEGITIIHFWSKASIEDIREVMGSIAKDGSTLRLWDFRNGGLDLSASQLRQLAQYGNSLPFPPSKVAIIAPDDLAFGLSRMYEVFRDDSIAKIRVFRTEQECLDWLK